MGGDAAEGDPITGGQRLDAALHAATVLLRRAGIAETPRLDARLLAASVLDCVPGALLTRGDRLLSAGEAEALARLVARRAAREPVSRILSRRGFWTFELDLGPETLDPRPDTEVLVQAALDAVADLERIRGRPLERLVDLGTGTGCVLLALLTECPSAVGVGVDISPGAAAVALRNARTLGLAERALICVGDWMAAVAGPVDLVVSNPPYIPAGEIPGLEPEVSRFDPWRALDGGADGLDIYRHLAREIPPKLTSGGVLAVEIGAGQGDDVKRILAKGGLCLYDQRQDLTGEERCIVARKSG